MGGGGEAGGSVVLFLAFFQGVGGRVGCSFSCFFHVGRQGFYEILKKNFLQTSVSVCVCAFFPAKICDCFWDIL